MRTRVMCSANMASVPVVAARWHRVLLVALLAAIVVAVVAAVGNYWNDPLGGWDAWVIWNQRARAVPRRRPVAAGFLIGIRSHGLSAPGAQRRRPLLVLSWRRAAAAPWLLGTLFTFNGRCFCGGGIPAAKSKPRAAGGAGAEWARLLLAAWNPAICRRAAGLLHSLRRSAAGCLRRLRATAAGTIGSVGTGGGAGSLDEKRGAVVAARLAGGAAPSFGDGVAREGSARSFSAGSPALADSGGRGDPKDLSQREQ